MARDWKSDNNTRTAGIRLGLCCQFVDAPIRFRNTTATSLLRLSRQERLAKVSRLCLENAEALAQALTFCCNHGIGCFRINSQILPVKTHLEAGYLIEELPEAAKIEAEFQACGAFAKEHGIRTTFHPDQFTVLNSPRADVVAKSIQELEYHAQVAEWVGADVINIHGGGAYGDPQAALQRFGENLNRLSDAVRSRLTVENDDTIYSPQHLLPICREHHLPLVYDVHHHRCLTDGLSTEEATEQAVSTWNREPLFHVSSPRDGWRGPKPKRHHDYIRLRDFPQCWNELPITVEVEAKAKELAVFKLQRGLMRRRKDHARKAASLAAKSI